ncbi:response regulator [Chitinophaga sp. 30R24]|uniref:response regulator n=1 Tax=Chitinophaga sp. 30R24 TaxID=3248838 RepID=UPI003B8F4016
MRILIIEQDLIAQKILQILIDRIVKAEIYITSENDEALTIIQETLPDLIFTDFRMRDNDNRKTLIEIIRNNESIRHIPIIVFTCSLFLADREAAEHAGVNEYYTSHVTKDVLSVLFEKYAPQVKKVQLS